jgi:hypothetical protein
MSENPNAAEPDPALRRLDRLVGTWTMEGNLVGSDERETSPARRHSGGCRAVSFSSNACGSTSWGCRSTAWS